MRLWSLLFVASCADETSLMQDVKKPSKSHRNGDMSVTNLMEAATNLLKNGATPDVVDFTEATLDEIEEVVIPAINNESATDQLSLYETHAMYAANERDLATDNLEVYQVEAEETTTSGLHKLCRGLEADKCQLKRICDMELYGLYVAWTEEEETLKETHHWIDGQFCVPGEVIDGEWVGGVNGTLEAFRTRVIPYMHEYRTQKPIVDLAITTYNAKIPLCDTKVTYLDTKSGECNEKQSELESLACRHAELISSTLSRYHSEYTRVDSIYQLLLETVLRKQEDRIQEYVTLKVVNCLLGRVHERNGRPCDESTGEVDEELSHCEEERLDVDYTHLELVYPPAPPLVPNCPSRSEVVGACQPVLQPMPCNNDYHQQEYGALPAVPEEPFSETNPGCNAYPACSACVAAPAPPPVVIGIVAAPAPPPVILGSVAAPAPPPVILGSVAAPAPQIAGMFADFSAGEMLD